MIVYIYLLFIRVFRIFPVIAIDPHQQGAVITGCSKHPDGEIVAVGKDQVQFRIAYSRVTVDRQVGCAVSAVRPAVVDLNVRQLDDRVVQRAGNLAGAAAVTRGRSAVHQHAGHFVALAGVVPAHQLVGVEFLAGIDHH